MKVIPGLPALSPNNEIILKDAITLLKNDFVDLYSEIGYDKSKVGIAWHTLRVSPKGVDMRLKTRGVSTIDKENIKEEAAEKRKLLLNPKEEVKMEKTAIKKEVSKPKEEEIELAEGPGPEAEVAVEEKPVKAKKEKIEKPKKEKVEGEVKVKGKKGVKKAAIMALIDAGETDWKVIVEKTGASQHFSKWLLKQSKKKAEA